MRSQAPSAAKAGRFPNQVSLWPMLRTLSSAYSRRNQLDVSMQDCAQAATAVSFVAASRSQSGVPQTGASGWQKVCHEMSGMS